MDLCQSPLNTSACLEGCSPQLLVPCYELFALTAYVLLDSWLGPHFRICSWCGEQSLPGHKSDVRCREITTSDFASIWLRACKEARDSDAKNPHTVTVFGGYGDLGSPGRELQHLHVIPSILGLRLQLPRRRQGLDYAENCKPAISRYAQPGIPYCIPKKQAQGALTPCLTTLSSCK